MAIAPRLDLRQAQGLVMTPQLQQAIKLLQMSNLELTAFVEREMERNPLLERDDAAPRDAGEPGAAPMDRAAERLDALPPTPAEDRTGTDRLAAREAPPAGDTPLDLDAGTVWQDRDSLADLGAAPGGDGGMAPAAGDGMDGVPADWGRGGDGSTGEGWEQALSRPTSLRDHLLTQVAEELDSPADRLIGGQLVDWLDEAGYLAGTVEEIAAALACPADRVAAVLARMQRFDPPGVFARSLKECLALQLAARDRLDAAMSRLLDNLALLGRGDLAGLSARTGLDRGQLAALIAEIRTLDPKPAWGFADDVVQPLVPDVLMRAAPTGGWIVELNPETLPRVLVNRRYYATVQPSLRARPDRDYLADCLATATWLTRALHQRATTIMKVASEIVAQQSAFFTHGIDHLRPLVLRDIAAAIGMHESTVSRVTSNKSMATPRGVFELKYFFTAAIGGTDGAVHSAEAVRSRIRSLIDQETPASVLSDDRIVDILKADGIDIARRTVAKYRENLGILSSVQRRRSKALSA